MTEKNYRISHNEDRFTQEYPFHSHDFYEIYFFAGGSVTYYIESKSYHLSEGDILIIPPRTLHRAVIDNTNASYDRYVLWIYNSCLAVNPGIKCFLEDIHQELSVKNTLLLNRKDQEAPRGKLSQLIPAKRYAGKKQRRNQHMDWRHFRRVGRDNDDQKYDCQCHKKKACFFEILLDTERF